jgi:hypothetical protein
MAGGLLNSVGLISFSPFSTCHILAINYKIYISKVMKVVREQILECTIKVIELFDTAQNALTETKEGKIVSVDILNTKFIRNNIKLADATTTSTKAERSPTEVA